MKIELIVDQCIGSGSCEMLAPTVFEVGDDGYAKILDDSPGSNLEKDVKAAEASCPTSAITVT
ncbi:MAG: ferredoxin [Actinomycetota bacterium]|nr:ferredoxin [Actinomycetota bacterium]